MIAVNRSTVCMLNILKDHTGSCTCNTCNNYFKSTWDNDLGGINLGTDQLGYRSP